MPSSAAARMMRMAISPRLATRNAAYASAMPMSRIRERFSVGNIQEWPSGDAAVPSRQCRCQRCSNRRAILTLVRCWCWPVALRTDRRRRRTARKPRRWRKNGRREVPIWRRVAVRFRLQRACVLRVSARRTDDSAQVDRAAARGEVDRSRAGVSGRSAVLQHELEPTSRRDLSRRGIASCTRRRKARRCRSTRSTTVIFTSA